MASYYDAEIEKQKKSKALDVALPILAAIEAIATSATSKGQNVGTNTLGLWKDVQGRRETALDRAMKKDEAAPVAAIRQRELAEYDRKDKARDAAISRYLGLPNLSEEDKADIQTDPFEWSKQAPERRLNQASVNPEVMDLLGKITDVASYNTAKAKIAGQYGAATANKLMGPSFRTAMPMGEKFALTEGGLPGQQPTILVVNAKGLATPARYADGGTPAASGHAGMASPPPTGAPLVKPDRSGPGGTKLPSGYRWTEDGSMEAIPGGPAAGGITGLTPGQKAFDLKFAADNVEFFSGGAADAQKNLGQLKAVSEKLKKPGSRATGPGMSLVPDVLQSAFAPEALDMREQVEEVVQRNLRLILGAQFTQKEGDRLIARAYNPNLKPEMNAARIDRLAAQMQSAYDAKLEAAKYFDDNGTLKGFDTSRLIRSVDDFDLDGSGQAAPPAAPASPGAALKGAFPATPGGSPTVWRRAKDGKEYEYDAATKQPTGRSR